MTLGLAAIVAAGIVLPYALRLQRVPPVTAIVFWLSSLALRGLTGALAVIYLLFFLPRSQLFEALTPWCLRLPIPLTASVTHIEGHNVGDVALFLPGVALALSVLYSCVETGRGARQVRRLVERQALGTGPRNSLIVRGPEVVFAVAGLARPRVLVSAGALTALDDDELAAGLDHEQAHIARRHRFLMLLAVTLGALGQVIPGTRRGLRELVFHLERDADRWALRRRNDRLALASVICKAAAEPSSHPALARVSGPGVHERLSQLLEDQPARHARPAVAALNGLAGAMVLCTILLTAVVPAAAIAGASRDTNRGHHHCER